MGKTALIGKEDIETDFSSEIIEIELPGGTRGLQGEQGIQGETGKTPEFHIGEVTDTENAEATITGTTDDPVLNLGLPKGRSGVWVGPSEPTDEDYNVWVDPTGTAGTVPTKLSQLTDDVGYSLITETGNKIYLTIDNSNYQLYATLKDKNGNVINTSNTIDLPLETMVVGASYDSQTKEIVLTLKNGNTTRFSVADLVSGLVSNTYLTTNYYNKSSVDTMIAGISASETLPVGSEIDFYGQIIPTGWQQVDDPNVYSTSEVKTEKTWIDGKPIYRKVYKITEKGTTQSYNMNVQNLDDVVSYYFLADYKLYSNNYRYRRNSLYLSSDDYLIGFLIDDTLQIRIANIVNDGIQTVYGFYFTVEYTKTTDGGNS